MAKRGGKMPLSRHLTQKNMYPFSSSQLLSQLIVGGFILSNHKKLSKKQKVFKWLRVGKTQTWIHYYKKIDKGLISRYAKELVEEGLLEIPIKKARVKLYQPTPIGSRIKVNQVKGKNKKFLPLLGSIAKNEVKIRHHRLGYKIEVLSPIRRKIHWDGTNRKLDGIVQHFLYWPSENPPRTTIRYQPSKKRGEYGQIVVWPPEKKLSFKEWKYWGEYLDKYIGQIYRWLMKIFQCELGLPQQYQKSEFGVPPHNELQKLACKYNFRYGDCWTDKSYLGEFESNDPVKAEAMRILMWGNEKIPQKVEKHSEELDILKKWITCFGKKFSLFLDQFEKQNKLEIQNWERQENRWDYQLKFNNWMVDRIIKFQSVNESINNKNKPDFQPITPDDDFRDVV